MSDTNESRLAGLNLQLPPTPKPAGLYRPAMIVGNIVYISGHAPLRPDGSRVTGCIGADLDLESGKLAARHSGLAIIATLRNEFGSLDRIKRVVKLLGLVNCTTTFQQHPAVINGCSELFVQVFGPENGVGARSAAGANSLPGNIAVEIEAIFEIV
ncbi:MAG: RidA family protein [Verrucomicrobia bacterium]|nr:RidA family protein [Verrucomicrobiota bacterium]